MDKVTIKGKLELDYKVLEAFRTLRTNLEFGASQERVIAVTSVMGKEGKSFVSFGLASTFAESGKKCLFIQCNLRETTENSVYQVEGKGKRKGLKEYLEGNCKWEEAVKSTDCENLYLLEAGSDAFKSPSELLGRPAFRQLVQASKESYDYVIMDTPAIGEVSDGLVAAHESDGVVIVIEPEIVSYEKAQKTKQMLEQNGCRILGVVMNKM